MIPYVALLIPNTNAPGTITAILQLVTQLQTPFKNLSGLLPSYYQMLASAERLMEIEDIEEEPKGEYVDRDKVYSDLKGICINNLDFTGEGIKELLDYVSKILKDLPKEDLFEEGKIQYYTNTYPHCYFSVLSFINCIFLFL